MRKTVLGKHKKRGRAPYRTYRVSVDQEASVPVFLISLSGFSVIEQVNREEPEKSYDKKHSEPGNKNGLINDWLERPAQHSAGNYGNTYRYC